MTTALVEAFTDQAGSMVEAAENENIDLLGYVVVFVGRNDQGEAVSISSYAFDGDAPATMATKAVVAIAQLQPEIVKAANEAAAEAPS